MMYLIGAKRDGFWRAGRQWFKEPVPVDRGEFDDEQWGRLEADPTIVIEPADGSETEPPPDKIPAESLRLALETANLNLDWYRGELEARDARIAELEEQLENAKLALVNRDHTEPTSTSGEEVDAPKGGESDDSPPAGDAEPTREERILAAARSLDPANRQHWTQTGKAVILHLRRLSGLNDVTAAERDAAQAAAGVGPAGG